MGPRKGSARALPGARLGLTPCQCHTPVWGFWHQTQLPWHCRAGLVPATAWPRSSPVMMGAVSVLSWSATSPRRVLMAPMRTTVVRASSRCGAPGSPCLQPQGVLEAPCSVCTELWVLQEPPPLRKGPGAGTTPAWASCAGLCRGPPSPRPLPLWEQVRPFPPPRQCSLVPRITGAREAQSCSCLGGGMSPWEGWGRWEQGASPGGAAWGSAPTSQAVSLPRGFLGPSERRRTNGGSRQGPHASAGSLRPGLRHGDELPPAQRRPRYPSPAAPCQPCGCRLGVAGQCCPGTPHHLSCSGFLAVAVTEHSTDTTHLAWHTRGHGSTAWEHVHIPLGERARPFQVWPRDGPAGRRATAPRAHPHPHPQVELLGMAELQDPEAIAIANVTFVQCNPGVEPPEAAGVWGHMGVLSCRATRCPQCPQPCRWALGRAEHTSCPRHSLLPGGGGGEMRWVPYLHRPHHGHLSLGRAVLQLRGGSVRLVPGPGQRLPVGPQHRTGAGLRPHHRIG